MFIGKVAVYIAVVEIDNLSSARAQDISLGNSVMQLVAVLTVGTLDQGQKTEPKLVRVVDIDIENAAHSSTMPSCY